MAAGKTEGFFSKNELKFMGFLAIALVVFPLYYGLPLLSPLLALLTSVRADKRKMVWLWAVASLLVLLQIGPFLTKAAGVSQFTS